MAKFRYESRLYPHIQQAVVSRFLGKGIPILSHRVDRVVREILSQVFLPSELQEADNYLARLSLKSERYVALINSEVTEMTRAPTYVKQILGKATDILNQFPPAS